jgi:predicted TIM-barrel fold metal-dependent hydrolase
MIEPILSADSHVFEPGDLWQTRVDMNLRDRAPRLVRNENGGEAMQFEDGATVPFVGFGSAGDRGKTSAFMPMEDVRRGGYDPAARLKEMAVDGVVAEVLYPSFGMQLFSIQDPPLQAACMRAYNDWLSEFCAAAPDRLIGQALIPYLNLEDSLAEVRRVAKLGFRGVLICGHPATERDYGTRLYEDLWAALQDAGLAASLHAFTGPREADRRFFLADYTLVTGLVQRSLALLIFSGVLERYPRLKLVSAENDIGWVAHFLLRMDHAFVRKGPRYPKTLSGELLPSELFRRQVRCTFMDDRPGILAREVSGTEVLMWSSDYPHDDSTWPESREVIDRIFRGVPEAERRQIIHDNAAALYGIADPSLRSG